MEKKWLLSALFVAGLSMNMMAQDDAVLMNINGKDITKAEFEYIYHKNNKQQVEVKSLEEYMPLFINYKLKVAAAEEAGIDTTAAFKGELDGYRQELARPYLTDRATEDMLLQEAYENYCKNVEISHILISMTPATPADIKKEFYNKAMEIAEKARAGEDFAALAEEYSDDPGSRTRGGYLGYVKGGRLIYPFETVAFSMNAGEISDPVETRFGYHVIKVHNVRADRGERLCAHIFLIAPPEAGPEVDAQKRALAEEIYADLMAGADFAEMAREKSEDQSNASRGGELPWCSSGDFVKEFEEAAFSLEKGEISAPIRSTYGYHIIKLIDKRGVPELSKVRRELTQRISRDERAPMGRNVLIARLKNETNYKENEVAIESAIVVCGKSIDSTALAALSQMDIALVEFADQTICGKDIASALEHRRLAPNHTPKEVIMSEINRIVEVRLLEIETASLESKYPEYSSLLNEYRDGMLLFEISNREVWEKASTDVKGLEKFFKKNKKNYTWERPRYKGFVVACADENIAKEVKKIIKKNKNEDVVGIVEAQFNNDSIVNVSIERGLYVEGDNAIVDELAFKGAKAEVDEKLPITFIEGKLLKKPESYIDVRGQVTADYQEYLEKVWVEKLNKNAKIEIHEDVLKTIN